MRTVGLKGAHGAPYGMLRTIFTIAAINSAFRYHG